MKTTIVIITGILILGIFIYFQYYKALHPSFVIIKNDHAISVLENQKIEFDYPVFKGWKTEVFDNRIIYKPASRSFLKSPETMIEIDLIDYDMKPEWITLNKFGVGYRLEYSSVEFDDGRGGGIVLSTIMNSAPNALPLDVLLKTIADTFQIKNR